jgi:hypothetical protein
MMKRSKNTFGYQGIEISPVFETEMTFGLILDRLSSPEPFAGMGLVSTSPLCAGLEIVSSY